MQEHKLSHQIAAGLGAFGFRQGRCVDGGQRPAGLQDHAAGACQRGDEPAAALLHRRVGGLRRR